MLLALDGLLKADLIEWVTAMTYQAASGAGAPQMRELIEQMGQLHAAARDLLSDPGVGDSGNRSRRIDDDVVGSTAGTQHRRTTRGQLDPVDSRLIWATASAARNGKLAPKPTRFWVARDGRARLADRRRTVRTHRRDALS